MKHPPAAMIASGFQSAVAVAALVTAVMAAVAAGGMVLLLLLTSSQNWMWLAAGWVVQDWTPVSHQVRVVIEVGWSACLKMKVPEAKQVAKHVQQVQECAACTQCCLGKAKHYVHTDAVFDLELS